MTIEHFVQPQRAVTLSEAPERVCEWFGLQFPAGTAVAANERGFHGWSRGLVASIVAFAVGAVLDCAVTEPNQHGFNVNKVGWILMIVGVVGAVVSINCHGGREHLTAPDSRGRRPGKHGSSSRFDLLDVRQVSGLSENREVVLWY